MEIQQLRHLIAAAKHRSIARAAEESNISQPGLSRSIRSLETRLGVRLLERSANGIEPTVFGQSVLRRAHVILNEVARAQEELRALEAAQIGDPTLGVTQNFAHYFIPEIMADLHNRHRDVRFNVVTAGTFNLIEMVRDATIDFGFGLLGTVSDAENLRFEFLRPHASSIVARAEHPLAGKDAVSAGDLADAAWITVNDLGFLRGYRNFFLSRGLPPPTPAITTDSLPMICSAMLHADLVTSISREIVQDQVDAGRLVLLNTRPLAERTRVGFVFRADTLQTPQMREALDAIRTGIGTAPIDPLAEDAPLADAGSIRPSAV